MKIIITNIMTPRMRSLSDPILDNSLAILDADLRAHGIQAKVIDGCNIDLYKKLTLRPVNKIFRSIFKANMTKLDRGSKPAKVALITGMMTDRLLSRYQQKVMDRWLREIAQEVAREQVPFLGIKTWYGEAYTWAKRLVELVNQYSPETITICGGPQANVYYHEGAVLKYSPFDLAIYSEGKGVLADIILAARSGKNKEERLKLIEQAESRNLIYRQGDRVMVIPQSKIDLNDSIIPVYENRKGKVLIHNLVDGLGCPWSKCNFCPHKNIIPQYQMRPLEDVLKEIQTLLNAGIGVFRFCGSDTPLKVGTRLAEEVLERKLNLVFSMFNRAVQGAKSQYAEIKDAYRILIRAGLRAVFMGMETANDLINEQVMNKGITCEDLEYTMKAINEAGELEGNKCHIVMSFIYPTPLVAGVTNEQILSDNLCLIKTIRPSSVLITPSGVFPNTAWYEESERFGFTLGENYLHDLMHCEYVLSKPPALWKNIPNITMNKMTTTEMFRESNQFRRAVGELGIPTNVGDEVMLMYILLGYSDNTSLIKKSREMFLNVTSCTYEPIETFYQQFNAVSRAIALSNFERMS